MGRDEPEGLGLLNTVQEEPEHALVGRIRNIPIVRHEDLPGQHNEGRAIRKVELYSEAGNTLVCLAVSLHRWERLREEVEVRRLPNHPGLGKRPLLNLAGAYIPMFGHVFDNTAGGYSYLDEDGVSHQAEATVRPFDKLISLLTACQTRGDALCATITGVKVLDNPYWGTSSKEADGSMRTVDLTVLLVTLPVKWKDAINANKSLNPDGKDLFYGDTAASPYKGFPYTLKHDREGCKGYSDGGALPLFGYQKDSINLAGYLGDWIISNAWPNVKYALE